MSKTVLVVHHQFDIQSEAGLALHVYDIIL